MVKITQDYVGDFTRRTFDGTNPCLNIVVHETANKKDGATAAMHARFQKMYPGGSWHAQADDLEVIESYPDWCRCWHAGDGTGPGNMSSLAIEICVNLDESEEKQVQAYKNAAFWVATQMVQHGIPLSRVRQHHDYSTWQKDCPMLLRDGKYWTWSDFKAAVAAYVIAIKIGEEIDASKPVVKPKPKPPNFLDEDRWWGKDTTRWTQRALGTPVDGEVWNQNVKFEEQNPALTSGWMWVDPQQAIDSNGSKMVHAIWKFLVQEGVSKSIIGKDDGLMGPGHIKGIQTWLKKIKKYSGTIDGKLSKGSPTVLGWQQALNEGLIKFK